MTYNRRGCGIRRCAAPLRNNPLDADPAIPLAMAYVRNESFGEIFDPERALEAGTVFPGLYKPFRGTGCTNNRYNGRGTYR